MAPMLFVTAAHNISLSFSFCLCEYICYIEECDNSVIQCVFLQSTICHRRKTTWRLKKGAMKKEENIECDFLVVVVANVIKLPLNR